MQVPADLSPKQLAVTFEPFSVRVATRDGSRVFLEGSLERGIVPKECLWMQGGGCGEDGFLLLLHKMNLELLQKWAGSFSVSLWGLIALACDLKQSMPCRGKIMMAWVRDPVHVHAASIVTVFLINLMGHQLQMFGD